MGQWWTRNRQAGTLQDQAGERAASEGSLSFNQIIESKPTQSLVIILLLNQIRNKLLLEFI